MADIVQLCAKKNFFFNFCQLCTPFFQSHITLLVRKNLRNLLTYFK